MATYLINKLKTHLSVADNKVFVPLGGWKEVTEGDSVHPETIEAVRKGWAELVQKKPKPFEEFEAKFEISESPSAGSMEYPKETKATKKETA